jgi:hypothetical protein
VVRTEERGVPLDLSRPQRDTKPNHDVLGCLAPDPTSQTSMVYPIPDSRPERRASRLQPQPPLETLGPIERLSNIQLG